MIRTAIKTSTTPKRNKVLVGEVLIPTTITVLREGVKWDIMIGSNWKGQVTLPLQVGVEYTKEELKAFVRMQRPSLKDKEFDVFPSDDPVFKS